MKKYQDQYFKKAKRDNYPARSVYKLKEMDKKFHLLDINQKVLDLGAAPGSWTMFAAQKVGEKGIVLAVDLNEPNVSFSDQVSFVQGDVFEEGGPAQTEMESNAPFDIVLSDMAPKTTGIKFTDQAKSFTLAIEALYVARKFLKAGGSFVVKILEGPDIQELQKEIRLSFKKLKHFKPKSSRAESKEIFLVGLEYKG
ncbi:MAG: RlmE family RNA methyltransferase [Desulfonatronovibrio sp. MSAO_Bac4]|nr:MAG: RlmE family RNA methyltransferase [Desulfonatronovibrio sp. MSAO_Bac4]